MKVRSAQSDYGAVSAWGDVTVEVTREEADELRQALAVVNRYEKAALRAAKLSAKSADFTMFEFAVKNDVVLVKIKQGACG